MLDKLSPGKGGVSTHLLGLIPRLKDDYAIYLCGLGGASEGRDFDKFKELDVPIYLLGVDKIYNFKAIKGFFKLIKLLKALKPDIVHTYLFSSNIYGIPAAWLAGVPVRISSRREVGTWKKKRHIVAERWISCLCGKVFVNSNAIGDHAVNVEKVKRNKLQVVYNGIDISRFAGSSDKEKIKSELGISSKDIVVGTVANLLPIKDHGTLLDAANKITDEFPRVSFIVVGGGPLLEEFREKVRKINKQDRIKYLGYRWDVDTLMPIFDIYVSASLMEGFSNSILEAMATDKPVIANKVGGNVEAVDDGITGYLIDPQDSKQLSEKIASLIKDADLRKNMGAAAKAKFLKEFRLEVMVNKIKQMYSELLNKSTRAQEHKSTRAQEHKSTRAQEHKSTRAQGNKERDVEINGK